MNRYDSVDRATADLEKFLEAMLEPSFGFYWKAVKRDKRVAAELRFVAKFGSQQQRSANMHVLVSKLATYPEYDGAVQTYRSRKRGRLVFHGFSQRVLASGTQPSKKQTVTQTVTEELQVA